LNTQQYSTTAAAAADEDDDDDDDDDETARCCYYCNQRKTLDRLNRTDDHFCHVPHRPQLLLLQT